jgi:hypothetical protein
VPKYRCYFIVGERIKSARNIEVPDDARALDEAQWLILESDALVIEVWQEKRFVGRWTIGPDLKVIPGGKE